MADTQQSKISDPKEIFEEIRGGLVTEKTTVTLQEGEVQEAYGRFLSDAEARVPVSPTASEIAEVVRRSGVTRDFTVSRVIGDTGYAQLMVASDAFDNFQLVFVYDPRKLAAEAKWLWKNESDANLAVLVLIQDNEPTLVARLQKIP